MPTQTPFIPFIPFIPRAAAETVVALADVTQPPYCADAAGKIDAADAINRALADVFNAGGGTVWLPAGHYRADHGIVIPPYTTLHGERGAVVFAYADDAPLFNIGGSAGVNGLTVYYPEQTLAAPRAYPFTFYTTGKGDGYMLASVMNCTVLNGWDGVGACVYEENPHEMFTIENVRGTFLHTAAEVYNQSDVGTWKRVSVSGKYWADCPFGCAPTLEEINAYTRKNTVGLTLGDLEWTEFAGLSVSDCKYGIHIVKGHRIEFAGSFFDASVTNCGVALKIDAIDERWGLTAVNCTFEGSDAAIENNAAGMVKAVFTVTAGKISGNVVMEAADPRALSVDYSRGAAAICACGERADKTALLVFDGDRTGKTDVAAALQSVLDSAANAAGAVVYLPGGFYRLERALTVPAGVELRGSAGSPTRDQNGSSAGTVLLSYYGTGAASDSPDPTPDPTPAPAPALLTLGKNAGVRGVRIVFPLNPPVSTTADLGTCYAIRGAGAGVYCVNCSIAAAAYGVDFSDCPGHYIKKLVTACYYRAMTVGGGGGVVEGCLQNGTVLLRCGEKLRAFFDNLPRESRAFEDFFPITRRDCVYLTVADGEGELIYNTFAYGVCTLLENDGAANTRAFNVGSDNIGGAQTVVNGGGVVVAGALRYAGTSYEVNAGSAEFYARLTINDKTESPAKINAGCDAN